MPRPRKETVTDYERGLEFGRGVADALRERLASLHCMQVNVQALYLQELDRPIPAIVR